MENIYVLMLFALVALAAIDLVVGVSNDAVNFLNSAIGSKVVSMRTIMIVASIGIAVGAIFSSGMMEVARKGIFNPGEFYFNEIMIIFMAVMITDVLLLDFFNTLGMPTSTTVSIVFELLGAAVAMALIKIALADDQTVANLSQYINTEKAVLIISGIFLSVIVAFSIGAIVQYLSRLFLTFNFEQKPKMYGALFSGIALTSITYFIFMKGLKGTAYYNDIKGLLEGNEMYIIGVAFIIWTSLSYILTKFMNINLYKIIITVGTFALALAFAGNDLVNFIGVPMAAWNSYEAWSASGVTANEFSMEVLAGKVPTPALFLFIAGMIMVVTLWFSSKAKKVAATEVNLARQSEGHERFQPNTLSRIIVRSSLGMISGLSFILPKSFQQGVENRFEKPVVNLPKKKVYELPAFDAVRASTNLMVAGILISIATSYKLPLSTTYVTFMVAMGTSLADRAWDRESAVYRVAGVLNVIGGWFFTAFIAFVTAAIFTYLIHLGGITAVSLLLLLVLFILVRNFLRHKKEEKEKAEQRVIKREELITAKEVIEETSDHISEVVTRVDKLYTNVVNNLTLQDLGKLKKTDKHVLKLNGEVDSLKDEAFYFIKSLDDSSVEASRFYLLVLGYLQDISQSISYISKASYKHVNNNHKKLKKGQIKDLKIIDEQLSTMLKQIAVIFHERKFDDIFEVIEEKHELFDHVSKSIEKQINRIRSEESSAKNTTLYFGNLLETKDLITAIMNLLELYQEFHLSMKKAKIKM
ncbi:inorganic phosphate transporter [Lutimonas saemankumensis]|uniref:inorganic phosphate transporter n=1 Tax=Lutimonas saemankumensis TaxID=483016 RepID=UPI001CD21E00|nr:inorganic phosphate transporter [Lutimonas saemankumensis]MCA0932590.1 inorganic phosphate transporter [Lutimonas saemankumensis]